MIEISTHIIGILVGIILMGIMMYALIVLYREHQKDKVLWGAILFFFIS